jgi:hypothetical protein
MIFDLTFVWHRYVRFSVMEDRLRGMVRKEDNKQLVTWLTAWLTTSGALLESAGSPPAGVAQLREVLGGYSPEKRQAVLAGAYAEARRAAAGRGPRAIPKKCPQDLGALLGCEAPAGASR